MLKKQIKAHFSGLYSLGRSIRDVSKNNKKLKETEKLYNATHANSITADAPIATIFINDGPRRINLVYSKFNKEALAEQEKLDLLIVGTEFANAHNFAIRIISRNELPNPRIYCETLKSKKIDIPEDYSFYTDASERVSGKTYRLSITKNDIFFTEKELKKLKEWIKDGKH